MKLKLKVCGMRDNDNINKLIDVEPDFIGFIFYSKSKRFVGEDFKINSNIPSSIKKTGVFVNSSINEIVDRYIKYNLDFIQLHGDESPEFCELLHKQNINVIKAFSISDEFDFSILDKYESYCKYFLFDTKTENYGGSGIKFNWDILKQYNKTTPFILSGGISLEDIDTIKQLNIENLHAIDINSRFETEPGIKDINKIKQFINQLNHKLYDI